MILLIHIVHILIHTLTNIIAITIRITRIQAPPLNHVRWVNHVRCPAGAAFDALVFCPVCVSPQCRAYSKHDMRVSPQCRCILAAQIGVSSQCCASLKRDIGVSPQCRCLLVSQIGVSPQCRVLSQKGVGVSPQCRCILVRGIGVSPQCRASSQI